MPNQRLHVVIAVVAGIAFGVAFGVGMPTSVIGGVVTALIFGGLWYLLFPRVFEAYIEPVRHSRK